MQKTRDVVIAVSLATSQERISASQLAVRHSDELQRYIAQLIVGAGGRLARLSSHD